MLAALYLDARPPEVLGSGISLSGRKICGPEGKNPHVSVLIYHLSLINHSLNERRHLQPRGGPSAKKPEVFSGPAVLGFHADLPTSLQPASIYGCHCEAGDAAEVRMLIAVPLRWPNQTAV